MQQFFFEPCKPPTHETSAFFFLPKTPTNSVQHLFTFKETNNNGFTIGAAMQRREVQGYPWFPNIAFQQWTPQKLGEKCKPCTKKSSSRVIFFR